MKTSIAFGIIAAVVVVAVAGIALAGGSSASNYGTPAGHSGGSGMMGGAHSGGGMMGGYPVYGGQGSWGCPMNHGGYYNGYNSSGTGYGYCPCW